MGHRYSCLENLCSLAVQCNIAPEQVEKDCRELAEVLEELTEAEDNHFTEYDVLCALKTYHEASEGAYRRKIDYIAQKTGIPLTPNKRNGRKQATHLKIARFTLETMNEDSGKALQGRPSKKDQVKESLEQHPTATKLEIKKATGLTYPTI